MKNNFLILTMLITAVSVKSQISIGKDNTSNSSVSLEFNEAENKGLILPYVETKTGITENGSVIYDTTDHKVKYLKNNTWFDLSVDTSGAANLGMQLTKNELTQAKTVIGENANTDTTAGILVLSDTNKAMILPKVASPHLNIINPASGMMVYDTTKKQLAVYNGSVWTFWKP